MTHCGGRAASRAALGYAVQRPDRAQQPGQREVFGRAADVISPQDVQAQLREAEGSYHYRLIYNPGAGDTLVDLREWTRDSMRAIEERQGAPTSWWGVVHDDHSGHSHVHVVAVMSHRLTTLDLEAARAEADRSFDRLQGREAALSREAVTVDLMSDLAPQRVPSRSREMEQEIT